MFFVLLIFFVEVLYVGLVVGRRVRFRIIGVFFVEFWGVIFIVVSGY